MRARVRVRVRVRVGLVFMQIEAAGPISLIKIEYLYPFLVPRISWAEYMARKMQEMHK